MWQKIDGLMANKLGYYLLLLVNEYQAQSVKMHVGLR